MACVNCSTTSKAPDFTIDITKEESENLERACREQSSCAYTVAKMLADGNDFTSEAVQHHYTRFSDKCMAYKNFRAVTSKRVMEFMETKFPGMDVSVDWNHTFKTDTVEINFSYPKADHAGGEEKTIFKIDATECLTDKELEKLQFLCDETEINNELRTTLNRDFPNTVNNAIDAFYDYDGGIRFEYGLLRDRITTYVNDRLNEEGITFPCRWTCDFDSGIVYVNRQF